MKTHRIIFGALLTLVLPAVLAAQPQPALVKSQPALMKSRLLPDWSLRSPTASVVDNARSLSVGVTVENVGNGTAPAAMLRVWRKSGGDAREFEVPAVKPGGSHQLDLFSVLALPDAPDGMTDTVFFEVTGEGDPNPRNNRAAVIYQIPPTTSPKKADLAVAGISHEYADEGARLTLSVQVANNGDTASGPATLKVSCRPPAWKPTGDAIPSVQPKDIATIHVEFAVPFRFRGQTVQFSVEALPVSQETNRKDNRFLYDVTLPESQPPPDTKPPQGDERLPNLLLSNPGWTLQDSGARLVFRVTVENRGEGGSGSTDLYLKSAGGEVSAVAAVQPLDPTGSQVCTLTVSVPQSLRGTTTEFSVTVDPKNSLPESNEDDNTISRRVVIPPVKEGKGKPLVPPPPPQFPILLVIIGVSAVAAASLVWLLTRSSAFRRARLRSRTREMARPEARPDEAAKMAEPPKRMAGAGAAAGTGAVGVGAVRKAKDDVYFTVTSPAEVAPKADFLVNVWAHLDAQREEMLKRARQAEPDTRLQAPGAGPFAIARDTELDVLLSIEDCTVEPKQATIRWTGAIANAGFSVRVNDGAAEGSKRSYASIRCGGLEIARVRFLLKLTGAPSAAAVTEATGSTHRRAFASYARADARDVLTCIQGMEKALPGISIFLDVLKFRSGEYWQTRLQQEILASDVFYLFWSKAAAGSEWVEKEWRFGLEKKGLDFIDPVPLVSPREAPPPAELSAKHFDDWELAFKSYLGGAGQRTSSGSGGTQP
jgi:hypothetical protein